MSNPKTPLDDLPTKTKFIILGVFSLVFAAIIIPLTTPSSDDTDTWDSASTLARSDQVEDLDPEEKRIRAEARPATEEQLYYVNELMEDGYRVTSAWQVESKHHRRGSWVAGRIHGPAQDGSSAGVWMLVGDPDDPVACYPASPFSEEFSVTIPFKQTKGWTYEMLSTTVPFRQWVEDQ